MIYGLDVNRSLKFWEPYLKFEKEILETMEKEGAPEEEIGK